MGNPQDRIIFALDLPTYKEAAGYVSALREHVGCFKVGLELFMVDGPLMVHHIQHVHKRSVMLDLKFHDIPETVARALVQAGDMGVRFATIHVQQRATMKKAVTVAKQYGIQLLAVTVLTSMTDDDLFDLDMSPPFLGFFPGGVSNRVERLAKLAWSEGVTGFVCSPMEVKRLRNSLPNAVLVTPGVRPAGSDVGDQKRIGTPSQAISDGANYIVVGRPIRDAADPVAAAALIAKEIDFDLVDSP
jgi:orotidine-5'-phosphate decarboxylase